MIEATGNDFKQGIRYPHSAGSDDKCGGMKPAFDPSSGGNGKWTAFK